MTKYTRIGLLLVSLELTAGGLAVAQGTGKVLNACTLLSGSEIRRIAGRPDLATGEPRQYQESSPIYSDCIVAGAVDIGITLNRNTNDYYARMRDTYLKAPPKLGFRVEKQGGLGDDAYWLLDPRGSKNTLETLVGERRLSVSVAKFTDTKAVVPEAEGKRIAIALATAVVPKLK